MKLVKITFLVTIIVLLNSCASKYNIINPERLNYNSKTTNQGVTLNYKYNLLDKKYAKKEVKRGVKLVAIKITNNSEKDLLFGRDMNLSYENGNDLVILEEEQVFSSIKQNTATYLLYLLLTPMTFNVNSTNSNGFQETKSSTPIGLVVGPGLAVGNMIAAGSANKKLKKELLDFDILGTSIKKGETVYGLIGIKSDNYDAIKIKIE